MSPKDCERVAITTKHFFENFDGLIEELTRLAEEGPDYGCNRCSLQLAAFSFCDSGASGGGDDLELDCLTAAKILPEIKKLVIEEMESIGADMSNYS